MMVAKGIKYLTLGSMLLAFLFEKAAHAQEYRAYSAEDDFLLNQSFNEETTSIVVSFIFHPWVTVVLFICVVLILLGIFFRFYKLVASAGFLALVISVFRMFSSQLFGSYSIFHMKVIIPLFILALSAKVVSGYISKKREEQEEELEKLNRRRSIKADGRKSSGLSRFGDDMEKRFNYGQNQNSEANVGASTSNSSDASNIKLNRNF